MAANHGVISLDRSSAPAGLAGAFEPLGEISAAEPSDERLMDGVRLGDASAFTLLVGRYQQRVIAYLLSMLRDREDALDGAQEVFVRLHQRAHLYEPQFPLRCWLYRIATNVAIDSVRRRKRRRWVSLGDALLRRRGEHGDGDAPDVEPTAPHGGPLGQLLENETTRVVRAAIKTLPERYRSVLVLRDLQELSYDEVARVLGCRVGTVKSRVNRARTMLRDKLEGYVSASPALLSGNGGDDEADGAPAGGDEARGEPPGDAGPPHGGIDEGQVEVST